MSLRLVALAALFATTAAAQPTSPDGAPDAQGADPVFGTATTPSVRPLVLGSSRAARGDVAWALDFADPNRPGDIQSHAVAPTPEGGACTLSTETLGGATSGPVVARYSAAGVLLWEHAVSDWGTSFWGLDMDAVGGACVAVRPVSSSRVGVARVDEDGVSWTRSIDTPDSYPNRVFVRSDETGGVWVGTGEYGRPPSPAVLSRLDASGMEVVHIVRDPSEVSGGSFESGVRALAVLPDGRAVAASDADLLLVVGRDGTVTSVPRDPDFVPTALALDTTVAEPAAFILGVTSDGRAEVRRIDLDGVTTWTANLGDAASFRPSPYNVTTRDGDVYAAWQAQDGARVARIHRTDGAVGWSKLLPGEGRAHGIVADGGGVVVCTLGTDERRTALSPNGVLRWWRAESSDESLSYWLRRTLIPCADGATCLFDTSTEDGVSTAPLVARAADATLAWSVVRRGQPAPRHALHDAVLAPDRGLYVAGTTVTEEGGRDLFVARISPEGALAWSVAVDGGGTSEGGRTWIGTTPDGGVVAATWAEVGFGVQRGLVVRLREDGTQNWIRVLENESGSLALLSVAVSSNGESYMVHSNGYVVNGENRYEQKLTSLAADGSTAWSMPFPDDLYVYPWSAIPTETGVALATEVFGQNALQVEWLDASGTSLRTATARTLGDCSIDIYGTESAADIDASGVVHFAGYLEEGPASCVGPVVFRFSPDGTVGGTFIRPEDSVDLLDLDVRPNGSAVVAHETTYGATVLSRIDADGLVWTSERLSLILARHVVAAGLDDEAFVAGNVFDPDDSSATTIGFSYASGTGEAVGLDRFAGLWTQVQRVVADSAGAVYVVLAASGLGVDASAVIRVDGAFSVPLSPRPSPIEPLLSRIGPNPVRAGGTLRLDVGAPAELSMFDLLGRRVGLWAGAVGRTELTVPDVATGVYVLRAASDLGTASTRIVVR